MAFPFSDFIFAFLITFLCFCTPIFLIVFRILSLAVIYVMLGFSYNFALFKFILYTCKLLGKNSALEYLSLLDYHWFLYFEQLSVFSFFVCTKSFNPCKCLSLSHCFSLAVTKSGMGMWDSWTWDSRTWDSGTPGLRDTRTQGRQELGTWDTRKSGLCDTWVLEDVINKQQMIFVLNLLICKV